MKGGLPIDDVFRCSETYIRNFRYMTNHQKFSFHTGSSLIFILVSMISIGSAFFYSLNRIHSIESHKRLESISRASAGIAAQADLLLIQKAMMDFALSEGDAARLARIQPIEKKLRSDIIATLGEESAEMEHLLDQWHASRSRLISSQGGRNREMEQEFKAGAESWGRLADQLSLVAAQNQRNLERIGSELESSHAETIRAVWWIWGGTAVFNILSGILFIRKSGRMMENDRQTSKKLLESEERLKLALSGADEGTWDLDIPSGRLNFDSQWGKLLGYSEEKAMPKSFEEWSRLIHPEDRDRVLLAMQNHVEGKAQEYSAEYRILSGPGCMRWVLGLGRAVSFDAEGLALRVVGVTRDITQRKESEEKIWQLAHYDTLTGLPNRALFYERLKHSIAKAKRREQKLAILFLDLDGFKAVNDLHGHDAGDELLRQVASRLTETIRGEDSVSRLGGDEFTFILEDIRQGEDAGKVAGKIIHALAEPVVVLGRECRIGGSIGIAVFPDDGEDLETLVKLSDQAMYCAKQAGRNNFKFHTA